MYLPSPSSANQFENASDIGIQPDVSRRNYRERAGDNATGSILE